MNGTVLTTTRTYQTEKGKVTDTLKIENGTVKMKQERPEQPDREAETKLESLEPVYSYIDEENMKAKIHDSFKGKEIYARFRDQQDKRKFKELSVQTPS